MPTNPYPVSNGNGAAVRNAINAALASINYDTKQDNYLRNAFLQIWQRYTGATITTGYLADGAKGQATGSTIVQSRQTFTLGQTDVPDNPKDFLRTVVTSSAGASNFAKTTLFMEGVNTAAGRQVTFTFAAKADAAKPIAVSVTQFFGTGGSPSTTLNTAVAKQTLSAAWVLYSMTFTVPSISGKTLGTSGGDYLALNVWYDAGSSFNTETTTLGQQSGTFDFIPLKLEDGAVSTAPKKRHYANELELCQRYARLLGGTTGFANATSPTTTVNAYLNTVADGMRAFPTLKRCDGGSLSAMTYSILASINMRLNTQYTSGTVTATLYGSAPGVCYAQLVFSTALASQAAGDATSVNFQGAFILDADY